MFLAIKRCFGIIIINLYGFLFKNNIYTDFVNTTFLEQSGHLVE